MTRDRQGRLRKKIVAASVMATALLVPMHVGGQQSTYSPRELSMLPEYCRYTQLYRDQVPGGNDPEKIEQWYKVFGGSMGTGLFHAMHHYCMGLTNVNYAKFWVRTPQDRRFQLGASINQFDYVIRASQPGDKMLPEFHTKKGESLVALGKGPLAIVEFERAIELKPDYWPPYAAMSDYYKETGNIKMARDLLERGLASSPDAKALTRRLAELDGTKGKPNTASQPSRKLAVPKPSVQESVPQSAPQVEAPDAPAGK